MIEKILSELQELPHGEYADDYGKGFSAGINAAMKIVQEVAKEYTSTEHINCSTDSSTEEEICTKCKYELCSAEDFPCRMCLHLYEDNFTPKDAPYQKGE